jgi:quercetin dioxygenase-like cupin family protein
VKFFIAALLFAASSISTVSAVAAPTVIVPGSLKWVPGTGTATGQMIAVLYGDPTKPGPFIIRVKSPDGFRIRAHYHASVENVTVIQGTLMLGFGDKADKTKTTAIPAGGFYSIPKGVHHFAFAKGETIVEVYSMGPRSVKRLEP